MPGHFSTTWLASFLAASSVTAALFAQVANPSSPSTSNSQQPGLSSGQQGNAQTQGQSAGQSGSSQLGTQSGNSRTSPGAAGMNAQTSASNEGLLAVCLIVDNEGEVAVSEIGRQRAENPEVKKFAEQMVTDHTQMLDKLRQVRGATASVSTSGSGSSDGRRPDFAQPGRDNPGSSFNTERGAPITSGTPAAQPANSNQGTAATQSDASPAAGSPTGQSMSDAEGSSFATIKRELGAQCLQSKRQELESKQGAEFDKCFMEMQVAMHMDALDTLKVFQRYAQGELRQVIDEAIPQVTAHLEHAKMTKQGVEGSVTQHGAARK